MIAALIVAGVGIFRRVELWTSGKANNERFGDWLLRVTDFFTWGAMQKGVVKKVTPAIGHTLIYLGFLSLLFATTMVFIHQDLGIHIYQGNFYLFVTILSDIFGLGLILGCGIMAQRRYLEKSPLLHSRWADSYLLIVLVVLCIQGFLLEGLRIHVTEDPWSSYSPVGLLVAKFFWFLSKPGAQIVHYLVWWLHTISVFAFIALIPYTKMFHALVSPVNLFFRRSTRPLGALPFPGDLEKLMETEEEFSIGLGSIKDYSWKQLLDLDSCTSCGRCQEVCPAYNSGKPLSPKWVILDSRNHALALGKDRKSKVPDGLKRIDDFLIDKFYLASSGVTHENDSYQAAGAYRGTNELIHDNVLELGKSEEQRIAGEVIDPNTFWSCTTCMACVEACPVGINHVDQIVDNRRNMVLMQGEIPSEAQQTLRALENRGNPYGPAEDRILWTKDLEVPILKEGDSVDVLYWVGCVSSFDPRKQKIAQSLVKIFNKAGVSYGILGNAEACTGDPARRIGEENLFQMLAKQNINSFQSISFKTLVTNCPHCFNSIKNEYGQFGDLQKDGKKPVVLHHSQFLQQLLVERKLEGKLSTEAISDSYTFHDPCYLGRYNDEYEAPRDALKQVKSLKILEMDRSKNKGMCCGAGGGHFWMDFKVGERINSQRVDQAASTGANKIATACPFCMQMMEDGVKLTNREEQFQVKDIAEVIAEQLL